MVSTRQPGTTVFVSVIDATHRAGIEPYHVWQQDFFGLPYLAYLLSPIMDNGIADLVRACFVRQQHTGKIPGDFTGQEAGVFEKPRDGIGDDTRGAGDFPDLRLPGYTWLFPACRSPEIWHTGWIFGEPGFPDIMGGNVPDGKIQRKIGDASDIYFRRRLFCDFHICFCAGASRQTVFGIMVSKLFVKLEI